MSLAAMLFSCTLDNKPSYKSKGNDIANYRTTQIGDQIWMGENLDYDVSGSICFGNEANCATYGRLYDWVTAMALPDSCKHEDCSSQIFTKHRGICPSDWHIPSDDEWSTLISSVGFFSATELKATSGWNGGGNGTDIHDFSALPGGGWFEGVGIGEVGNFGGWWGSSEKKNEDDYKTYAYYRGIFYNYDLAVYGYVDKSSLFSVRCIKN
jgi:uncharacterized protein (TIGR02145 family)